MTVKNNLAIELSQQLIAFPSFSGKHQEVIEFINNLLKKHNFDCHILDFDGDGSYPVNNLYAIYNPNNAKKALYFAGHTDVVAIGDLAKWQFDPFSATIDDGKLFGRGASDMKCAIACFISAALDFIASKQGDINFAIGFLITNDEEADGINGTKKILQWIKEKKLPITHAIVGEPTNPNHLGEMIKIGRRGSINFSLKIIGKQGHVAYPENAINPTTILLDILKTLKQHRFDDGNKFFDPTNLEITAINSDNFGNNVVPMQANANFNIRFNDFHHSKQIIELIDFVCSKNAIAMQAQYELNYRLSGESFLSEPKELAKIAVEATKEITGFKPKLSTTGGTSDARFIKDYAQVIELGLVNKTAHQVNEYANLNEINDLYKIYLLILEKFNQI